MKQRLNNYLKHLYIIVSLLVLSAGLSCAHAEVRTDNPYLLITDVANELFDDLATNKERYREDPELLKALVENRLLPYINCRYASYKVLSKELKVMQKRAKNGKFLPKDKEQIDAFVDAFCQYLITSYASVLTLYDDQKFSIEEIKDIDDKTKNVSVKVQILQTGTSPINLHFKLRKNGKEGTWSTYDLVAEGVSMITTKQNEWQSTLRKKNGIELLTKKLNKLANVKIEYKAE